MAEEAKMVPKLRFKGFSEPWRQEALSKEFKRINERNNGQFGKDRWISVANMFFQDPDKVQTNNIDTRTYVMRKGDIAFEGHPNKEFKFGRFVANDIGDGVVSELFPVYKHVRDYDSDYWKYAIHLNWIMTPIFAKSITSSGNSSNKLDAKHFLRQEIRIPSLNEQQNIGDLLKKMDAILTLHEEKLGQLKALKRGMLQKLFPAQGDVVPVLRHERYTDTWQQEKIGNLMEVTSVKRVHQNDWQNQGIRFLRARDIVAFSKDIDVLDKVFISQEQYNKYSKISGKVQIGDLLVTGVGTIGVPYLIESNQPVYFKDGNIIWFKNQKIINGKFFYYSFTGNIIQNFIKATAGLGTVGTYTIKTGKITPIAIPKKDEQLLIGNILSKIDILLVQHKKRITQLQKMKKFLLQNLFI